MIRLMAQDFARKELEPFAGKWDREETFPGEAIKKMGGLGLMGMMIPVEYGGAGAGAVSYSLALQEIAYACASTAVTMSVTNLSSDPLLKFGTEEQKLPLPDAARPGGDARGLRRHGTGGGLRPGEHDDARRGAGRPLPGQRFEALHHERFLSPM